MASAFDIYTDGSCSGNPGPGGWGAIVTQGDDTRRLSGGHAATTNNRMEITAAIKGLEATPPGADVTIHSDSEYLVKTMTKNWKRNVNKDLWEPLERLVSARSVRFEWVRGHAGHPQNEAADRLAVQAMKSVADGTPPRTQPPLSASAPSAPAPSAPAPSAPAPSAPAPSAPAPSAPAPSAPAPSDPAPTDPAQEGLTHLDPQGSARMVDVGDKPDSVRSATAAGVVTMLPETLALILEGNVKKGDVFTVARLAGINAAKHTWELIPLAHQIPLSHVSVDFDSEPERGRVNITAGARTTAKTGVEMEALTAAAAAALTIYDMCKAVDRGMAVESVRLVEKTGGTHGDYLSR